MKEGWSEAEHRCILRPTDLLTNVTISASNYNAPYEAKDLQALRQWLLIVNWILKKVLRRSQTIAGLTSGIVSFRRR